MNRLYKFVLSDGSEVTKSFNVVPINYPISSGSHVVTGDPLTFPSASAILDVIDNVLKIENNTKKNSNDWYISLSGSSNLTASAHIVSGSYITASLSTVFFNFIDHVRTPLAVKSVEIKPKYENIGWQDSFVLESPLVYETDGVGSITVNLVPQTYDVTFHGDKKNTKFSVLPSGSCTASAIIVSSLNVARVITPQNQALYGYTSTAADARFVVKGGSIDNAVSASYALTASHALNGGGSTDTSSLVNKSGANTVTNNFSLNATTGESIGITGEQVQIEAAGIYLNNNNVGSPVYIGEEMVKTSSVSILSATGSLYGTASWAYTSSFAGIADSASYAATSSLARGLHISKAQPDATIEVTNSASYGRLIFTSGSWELATIQALGTSFDQQFATTGRSNALELFNNGDNINLFTNGNNLRARVNSRSLSTTVPVEVKSRFVETAVGSPFEGVNVLSRFSGSGASSRLGVEGKTNTGVLFVNNESRSYSVASFIESGTAPSFTIYNDSSSKFVFYTNPEGKSVIGNGNSPQNTLDVIGNISCSVITASLLNGTASLSKTASVVKVTDHTGVNDLHALTFVELSTGHSDLGIGNLNCNPALGYLYAARLVGTADNASTASLTEGSVNIVGATDTLKFYNGDSSFKTDENGGLYIYLDGGNVTMSIGNSGVISGAGLNGTASVANRATTTFFDLVRKEPTGFPNKTDSVLSYNSGSATFTIAPTGTNFDVYCAGVKYSKTTEQIVVTGTTVGTVHFIYYNDAGVLTQSTTAFDLTSGIAPITVVYIDGNGYADLSEERHGIVMDSQTQEYLHETAGPQWASGMTWTTVSASTGRYTVSAGEFYDDDNEFVTATTSASILAWYSGSVTTTTAVSTSLFAGVAPQWNDTTTGARTTLTGGQHGAYFYYVINGYYNRFLAVMGQRQDSTLAACRLNNTPDTLVFGNFPFQEAKLLYRVIVNTGGIVELTDYRTSQVIGTTFVPTDHGSLSGLNDDDHSQYLLLSGRTGGQNVVGGITSSLEGTSSWSTNAANWASASTKVNVNSALINGTAQFLDVGAGAGINLTAAGTSIEMTTLDGQTFNITNEFWTNGGSITFRDGVITASRFHGTASWASNTLTSSRVESLLVQPITSSRAISASYAPTGTAELTTGGTYPITSSWALTASVALNAGGPVSYTTIVTSSNNWITASLADANQFVAIATGLPYNFTCSNLPAEGITSETSVLLYNTATTTSSLSFPTNWIFLGGAPLSISSSRSAVLSLKAYGTGIIVAGFAIQY